MNWAWPRMRDAVPQQCNLGTKLYANMMIHPFFLFLGKRTRPRSHDDTRAGGYQETIAFKYVYIRFGCSFVSSLHPILTLRVCAVPLHASLVFTSKIVRIKAGYEKCLLLTFDPCEHPKMQSTSAHDFAIDCGPRIDPGASWPKHLNPPHIHPPPKYPWCSLISIWTKGLFSGHVTLKIFQLLAEPHDDGWGSCRWGQYQWIVR